MDNLELLKNMLLLRNFNPQARGNLFMKMYPFSNENLGGYMSKIDLEGKSVLTTGSGTEQVFNLAFYGATNIKVYDINPFVKYHFALKLAGLKELDDKDYFKFFHTGFRGKKLSIKYYEKLRTLLDPESREFWDLAYKLYLNYNPKLLFKNDEITKKEIKEYNPYFKDRNRTIKRIEQAEIEFKTQNILDLNEEMFDYMFLSNVLDYIDNLNMRKSSFAIDKELFNQRINDYIKVVEDMGKHLNDNGMLFYHYFWDVTNEILDFYRILMMTLKDREEFKFMKFGHFKIPDGVGIYKKIK